LIGLPGAAFVDAETANIEYSAGVALGARVATRGLICYLQWVGEETAAAGGSDVENHSP